MNWPNIRVRATLAGASLPGSYLLNEISSLLLIAIVEIHPFPLSTELNLRSDRKISAHITEKIGKFVEIENKTKDAVDLTRAVARKRHWLNSRPSWAENPVT